MNNLHRKQFSILSVMLIMLLATCQPSPQLTIIPTKTPSLADTIGLWSKKDSSININHLGNGRIYALSLSPNGAAIAVAQVSGIMIYDFNTLKEIWHTPITTLDDFVIIALAWSPDSSQLASTINGNGSIWNGKTGKLLKSLNNFSGNFLGNTKRLNAMTWSPDGKILAATTNNQASTLILWDTQTAAQMPVPETIISAGLLLGWISNGETLRISQNSEIISWNIVTGKQSSSPLVTHARKGQRSPDGTLLISNQYPGPMTLWDTQSGCQLPISFNIPNNSRTELMAWSPNAQWIAATKPGYDKLWVWNAKTGELLHAFTKRQNRKQINQDVVLSITWTPDSKSLISVGSQTSITIWDVETGKELRALNEHIGWIISLAWSPDGNILAWSSEDGEITLWDPAANKKLRSFHEPKGSVVNLRWSPDGKLLASGADNGITIWEAQTGQPQKVMRGLKFGVVAWSPDGKKFASAANKHQTTIWDASSYQPLGFLKESDTQFEPTLNWSPHGDLLTSYSYYYSSSGSTYKIVVWDAQTGEQIRSRNIDPMRSTFASPFAWNPSNDIIASINYSNFVLWNARTGEDMYKTKVDTDIVSIADWSPDGRLLIANGHHSLLILNTETGEILRTLKDSSIYSIGKTAWSPRGDRVATASLDGIVTIWRVQTSEKQP